LYAKLLLLLLLSCVLSAVLLPRKAHYYQADQPMLQPVPIRPPVKDDNIG
jgi:hypothetical protein